MPKKETKPPTEKEINAMVRSDADDRTLQEFRNEQKAYQELRQKTKNLEPREVIGMLMSMPIPSEKGHRYANFAEFSDEVLVPIYRKAYYHSVSGEKLMDTIHFNKVWNLSYFDTESIRFGVEHAVHIDGRFFSTSPSECHETNSVYLIACPEIFIHENSLIRKYTEEKYPENKFQEAKELKLLHVTFMLFDEAQFKKLNEVLAPEKPPRDP